MKTKFNGNKNETDAIKRILSVISGSAYGARLEITCLNLSKQRLKEVYGKLEQLGTSIIETHNALANMYWSKRIPFETLRLSPIQVVSTSSLVALAGYQSLLLDKLFSMCFNCAIKGMPILIG